jgi:hypothetical protein
VGSAPRLHRGNRNGALRSYKGKDTWSNRLGLDGRGSSATDKGSRGMYAAAGSGIRQRIVKTEDTVCAIVNCKVHKLVKRL